MYVVGPMPTVGVTLKAALLQAASMSVFVIKVTRVKLQGCRCDYRPPYV